jgi:cell division protein ZapE
VKPTEYYQKLGESEQILPDPQQQTALSYLDVVYDQLTQGHIITRTFIQRIFGKPTNLTKGVYLWGDVGIGKTFLMDCFFYCLPFENKLRVHFHSFMKMIHDQLEQLKGETKPLLKIAQQLAKNNSVICFDELVVHDISDAMLLAGLFRALYQEKICLIFTSNTSPDNLYLKGLQRQNFLPAIELIKIHSQVIAITTRSDYRLKNSEDHSFYYTPLNEHTAQLLQDQFSLLSQHRPFSQEPLRLNDRNISIRRLADGVVWFDFLAICGIPRSQNDFLEITKKFHTVMISGVKVITSEQNDLIRTFINLVDVLYDANKRLIIAAEKPIAEIYPSGKMLFEFARTRSRIVEMQTRSWHEKCARNTK